MRDEGIIKRTVMEHPLGQDPAGWLKETNIGEKDMAAFGMVLLDRVEQRAGQLDGRLAITILGAIGSAFEAGYRVRQTQEQEEWSDARAN